jgi:tRNA-dihydrouridine synthase B
MIKIQEIILPDFPLLLAPMEDVSDPPFRYLCKQHGADLMYSEFISADGLIHDAQKSLMKLDIFDYERPIGIQYFGGQVDSMIAAAHIVEAANPDLIDINFGCPVAKVACKMAGAGLLQDIPQLLRISEAVVKSTNKPVTIKTRLGWDENSINIVEVAERLQDVGVQAITIHARTRKQMYKGMADWTWIAKVKENPRLTIPVFGNGDVDSPERAAEYKRIYGPDGIMIGRAAIGYPWIFREIKHYFETGEHLDPPTVVERVEAVKGHLQRAVEWKGVRVGIVETRRHYTNYFKGLPGIKEFRSQLVQSDSVDQIEQILYELQAFYSELETI